MVSPLEKKQKGQGEAPKEYCPKASKQYLTFMLLDPDKRSSVLTKMRLVLGDIDKHIVDTVLHKLDLLFKYRITEHELSKRKDFVALEAVEALLTEKQRENILREYCLLSETLSQSLHYLSSQQLIELLSLMNLSNIRSHVVATSIVRRLTSNFEALDRSQLKEVVEAINSLCKQYDSIEGLSLSVEFASGIKEAYICDFLDGGSFNSLILRLNDVMATYPTIIDFMDTIGKMLQLMAKFVKVGALSHSNKFFFFDKLSARLYREIDSLQHADGNELVQVFFVSGTIMQMGAYSPLILKVFRVVQQQMLAIYLLRPGMRRFDILKTGLNTYASIGLLDKGIFEQLYKPMLLGALDTPTISFVSRFLPSLISFAAKVGLQDRTINQLLVGLLQTHTDFLLQQHPLLLRNLHLNLKFGFAQKTFLPEDRLRIQKLLNFLAAHCICTQHDLKLAQDFELPTSHDINCVGCDHSRDLVLSHKNAPIAGGAQKFADNHNERIIKSQLRTMFEKYFDQEIKLTTEGQPLIICLYKWDALLECPALGLKVGLEITGQGYKLDKDLFIKKKQMKFTMLQEAGYLPMVIDVTSSIYKNIILDFDLPLLEKVLALDIYLQIKDTYGVDLGFKPGLFHAVSEEVQKYKALTV